MFAGGSRENGSASANVAGVRSHFPNGKSLQTFEMSKTEFPLRGEYIELNQLLKLAGVCDSGGAGKRLVAEGQVQVDGLIESRKTAKIRAGQVVRCGPEEIRIVAES